MAIADRYLAKLYQLNSARIVPDRIVISPEAFHDLQFELALNTGTALYFEIESFVTGLKESLFGIPAEIDPRLEGNTVRLEIDI